MQHQHIYDKDGKQLCCTQTEKVYSMADASEILHGGAHEHGHQHDHDHAHEHQHGSGTFALFIPSLISFFILLLVLVFDTIGLSWFNGSIRIIGYSAAYIPVGYPVLKEAFKSISKGEIFSEFFLMGIASIGALALGEYPEAVAVMLFYTIGENLQTLAVRKAKKNIQSLLDQRPDFVHILDGDGVKHVKAETVEIGNVLEIKPGEKVGLDGILLSELGSFNISALSGESTPQIVQKGETVFAGSINMHSPVHVQVNTLYQDSKLSHILELVQTASAQKAPSELFIRRFARLYTPVVVLLALLICFIPYFLYDSYSFQTWLYRALIFLIISCPCALVISIPLGYFGGIGAGSRHGILFKGGNFLDKLAAIQHLALDKTGTLTKGVFNVQSVHLKESVNTSEILSILNAMESRSTHPVARAIVRYFGPADRTLQFEHIEEIPGYGLKAIHKGQTILAGNFKLLDTYKIQHTENSERINGTAVAIAIDSEYLGYLKIEDSLKDEAEECIAKLKEMKIKVSILSGDKSRIVKDLAEKLKIEAYYGDMLPEDKVNKLKEIKASGQTLAFAGDGFNDAPAIALSDVGIAMGGLGSDAAIETADVVIQDDNPLKIPMAIQIGKQTKRIVWQNISMAFSVKAVVLILGAGGLATLWEAVFADVGVALLAILNSVRIQNRKF